VGINEYYRADEEYFHAPPNSPRNTRRLSRPASWSRSTILSCGRFSSSRAWTTRRKKRRAEIYVEAINVALKGIPADKVRFHTCYGINEGPRLYEAALSDIIGYVLKINAGSYSFEAANPRHEREYHLFETVKVPDD
jgi:5-methyltetrahydropteroyltriglutamate--homocysteine methyltransferase